MIEPDIWRSANILLNRHGGAFTHALFANGYRMKIGCRDHPAMLGTYKSHVARIL